MIVRYPLPSYDWDAELDKFTRLDDHLTDKETAARLAEIDRLTAPLHRPRRGRAVLIGVFAGTLIGFAMMTYYAHGAESRIASTDVNEVCASDGLPGSSYSRAHRVVKRHPVPGHEIDHIVPLALGGADTDANIQVQTRDEAALKDELERFACIAVCRKRTMSLAEGQAIFLGGWEKSLWRIGR